MAFKVLHNLEQLTVDELRQYLRDVSVFIGLDPDLEALDTIWMNNETGPGRSLVVYARRGTAEILRNVYEVEVKSQTFQMLNGSIVYTTVGVSNKLKGRQEVAIGSKYIEGLTGKELDDAIMTGSTRSLRRLTMQFTTLGILDESEVVARLGDTPNPAGSVRLAADSIAPMYALPTVPANNAPGKPVEQVEDLMIPSGAVITLPAVAKPIVKTVIDHEEGTIAHTVPLDEQFVGQQAHIDAAWKQVEEKEAAKQVAIPTTETVVTPVAAPATGAEEAVIRPVTKRARKPRGIQLDLDVVAETVSTQAKPAVPAQAEPAKPDAFMQAQEVIQQVIKGEIPNPVAVQAVVPTQAAPAAPVNPDLPSREQMATYRQKIGVFTSQLPASAGMDATMKMRAFIAQQNHGTPTSGLTVEQWNRQVAWFEEFSSRNGVKNLIKYINDCLGVQ